MTTVSISEIKKELDSLPATELTQLCLRLARYKKENKELLHYLLFAAHDNETYASQVKEEMNELFDDINASNLYFAKKTIRKILRVTNKHIRYTGDKQTEVVLLIYFCEKLKLTGIPFYKNKALENLYLQQIKKINVALSSLHDDIQYDFAKQVAALAHYR
ncbi:hypothetical protein I5907_18315 [Panacibacter sp. DH6]|uniref:Uncharacterized protein n=2 Tax=Panacibacter microcysteis TaxID=2793269 RepID=A0A931GZG3_9BACT|nr:hypothetical protein [Panacibacter microcysteis]